MKKERRRFVLFSLLAIAILLVIEVLLFKVLSEENASIISIALTTMLCYAICIKSNYI